MAIPPFPGTAVNVTEEPRQKGFDGVEMVRLTGSTGLTDTGYGMLVAGLLVAQGTEDVIVHETKSPFKGMEE